MCDVQSGMASAIIQIYLKQVSQKNTSKVYQVGKWECMFMLVISTNYLDVFNIYFI